jgi:hypothetical protein
VRQEPDPKLPACFLHQVVVFENKMYLFGGYGDGGDGSGGARYVEKIWSSSDGAFWSEKSSTLIFKNHQVVVFNNKLFWIAGQSKNNGEENSVYSSTDGATFKVVIEKAGFTARTAHQVVVFKDKLYLIGGITVIGNDFKKLNDVWSSTDGKNWTQETEHASFSARWSHQVVVFKNKIYLIAGEDSSSKVLNDVWSSTDGKSWTQETDQAPFSARRSYQLVVFKNKIYLIGGYEGTKALNDVWSYELPPI